MAWGSIPDDHKLMVGMVRPADQPPLRQRHAAGIGLRVRHRQPLGPTAIPAAIEVYTKDRKFVHIDIEPTQIGRVFGPDFGIVSDAGHALQLMIEVATEWKAAGKLKDRSAWVAQCQERKRTMQRKTHFEQVPVKPQRVYEEMNRAFSRDTCYVSTIGLSQIAAAQFLHVYHARHWINCGQAGPLGWTISAALGRGGGRPAAQGGWRFSGDYDFQFMIEELAVGRTIQAAVPACGGE